MSYYFSKTLNISFEDAILRVTDELKKEGFGILTEIDVRATLKKKLNEDFRPYLILGACNPPFAFKALKAEDKIGLMLPCNVVIQQRTSGEIEVSTIDPLSSMQAIYNPKLEEIARTIRDKMKKVVDSL
ncbi:DUF302 domain-containing protein [Candidatus Riflebacteria bacterium]